MKLTYNYKLWEKLKQHCFIFWLLSDVLFALAVVELKGDWRMGAFFFVAHWTYTVWLSRTLEVVGNVMKEEEWREYIQSHDDGENEEYADPKGEKIKLIENARS